MTKFQKWGHSQGLRRGKHSLEELVRRIPEDYDPTGEAWGPPVGKEVW